MEVLLRLTLPQLRLLLKLLTENRSQVPELQQTLYDPLLDQLIDAELDANKRARRLVSP